MILEARLTAMRVDFPPMEWPVRVDVEKPPQQRKYDRPEH
jgi:hypothetical protein